MSITQARTLIVKHHKYAWILTLAAVFVISGVYFRDTVTHAATFYFRQSSWLGGPSAITARHELNQDSNWNTYDSASTTLVIGNNITLVPSTPWFTDDGTTSTNSASASGGDFDNGSNSNTTVSRESDNANIGLLTSNIGTSWTQATSSANWSTRYDFGSVVFDGKMWITGGRTTGGLSDVWYSYDGTNWTRATASAAFGTRYGHSMVVYNNKMWLFGGYGGSYSGKDVWYSTNGVTWTLATSAAAYAGRAALSAVVYDNKMWVMGGLGTVSGVYNDVWYSTDGITWTQATAGAAWTARYYPSAVVYDNKMWVMGGNDGSAVNDVWYSTDGITWTQATAAAGWNGRQGFNLVVYDNKMWVMGGNDTTNSNNNIWYSSNGSSWTQATSAATWSARSYFGTLVFNNTLWVLGGYNSGTRYNNVYYIPLASSGTFTSAPIDMGGLAGFTTIGFGSTSTTSTSVNVDVRAGSTSDPNDGTWDSWLTGLSSGGSIESFSGKRYIQYRVNFTTSSTYKTSIFDYLTINYTEYTPIGSLVSSAYNSESDANIMGGITWTEDATLPTGTTATFYLRTSATSNFSGSSWSTGITSGTTGCSKVGTTVTCTSSAVDSALRDGINDQWLQYKVTLTSLGSNTPTIDDIRVAYVVNSPPTFDTSYNTTGVLATQNTTIGDADYGKVNISYRVGDLDTASFTPSFKYSVNGGSSWSDIPSNDLSADATSLKTYTGGATTTFSVVWNATSTLSANPVNIANAKVRVTVNDGDAANNIGTADSAVTTLDTTAPEITSGNFVVDSSVDGAGSAGTPGDNRAGIKLYATDYSTIQYRLCNDSAFPSTDAQGNSCAWSSLSASPISLATSSTQWITTGYPSAETVYMQVRDAYGNVTTGTASAPAMPGNFDYKDVSNTDIDVYREFLSWSVFSATESSTFTGDGSGRYKLYHAAAASGASAPASSAYSVVTSISDPSINYTTHNITSATTSVHYYKVTAVNDQGSISDFTAVLSDIPNGSGGAVSLPPQITDTPTADTIRNTSAHITFTTDSLATSTIEYGTTNSYGSTAYQTSFVENHSVYLNSLSPNTAYYFRAKATNAEGQDSDWATGTTFTTAQGTVISGVTPMNVTDKTATIFWNTNASSTSKVYYGTGRSGSTLTGSVTVTGTSATTAGTNGLYQHQVGVPSSGAFTAGNTYYYKVESTDGDGNTTTDDNNGQFYSFTTTLDTTAPTISDISAAVVGPTSAVIVWTTDEPATSQVRWSGTTGNHSKRTTTDMTFAGIPSYSVYHVATLSSQTQNVGEGGGTNVLVAETPYYYTVVSADAAGNETESAEQTLTTTRTGEDVVVTVSRSLPQGESGSGPTADTTSPVVTNMKVSDITPFTATVTFDTSEASVGKLGYSKDTSFGDHAADDFSWGTKHSIKLRGLTLGTQYHIKAMVVDKAGNTGYSEEQTFKTSFLSENIKELAKIENIEQFQKEIEDTIESILPSLVPPFVSKPSITDITESGATISFKTNIKAFPLIGFVEDGTYDASKENPYASEVSDTTEKATNHTLALLNLKPNTKYHVQARAFSLPQVVGKSEDLTFTTQASKIQSSIVETKRDSFTVVWITDEPTTSIVEYKDLSSGITQRKADERKTTSHSVKIENLSSGTSFDVNVSGLNEGGNLIEGGSTLHVTTSRDVAPPTISNFKVSNAMVPGRTDRIQTIISWTTNEPADSVVYYEEGIGTAGAEEKELANKSEVLDAYVLDHNIIISSLKPGAIYRIKVTSVDESGNLGVFGPRTIITPKQTESITDIIFKNFEDSFKFLRDM